MYSDKDKLHVKTIYCKNRLKALKVHRYVDKTVAFLQELGLLVKSSILVLKVLFSVCLDVYLNRLTSALTVAICLPMLP